MSPNHIHLSTRSIEANKHWNLRAGLGRALGNAVKEVLLDVVQPVCGHGERLLIHTEDLNSSYDEANLVNPIRTKAVLEEWCPWEGEWDLFFLIIDLLASTHLYLAKEGTPINFTGFNLEDAITLLSLDFTPHPNSYCASTIWDTTMCHTTNYSQRDSQSQTQYKLSMHSHEEQSNSPCFHQHTQKHFGQLLSFRCKTQKVTQTPQSDEG
ncbi:hypothetical protein KEM48_010730 [Puccinia striiformis f. sp. tritici PST-130]|nr:hypothetical protein KEM48_010730 [Puccinia striiformis f. sp. tritici PST-130]